MPRHELDEFDKELRKTISENLKRYTSHLTQSELSELTGIPASTLSGYFAMRSTPNAGNVQKIADVLNVKKSDIDPRFEPKKLIDDSLLILKVKDKKEKNELITLHREFTRLTNDSKEAVFRVIQSMEKKGDLPDDDDFE